MLVYKMPFRLYFGRLHVSDTGSLTRRSIFAVLWSLPCFLLATIFLYMFPVICTFYYILRNLLKLGLKVKFTQKRR
jgi:hypothetical protein